VKPHMPTEESVRVFASTLPDSYRRNFELGAIAEHARIAFEREATPANVGKFMSNRGSGEALCVVADDRPGLLATISAALVMCGLDVIEAEAYTRRLDGVPHEAVDVFWVRHESLAKRGERVGREQVAQLRQTLVGLLEGKLERRRLGDSQRPFVTPASVETVVRFIENADGNFSTLEVETGDRSGLLLALSQALFNQRVQIIGSQVKTVGARVYDRFHIVELDGSAIGAPRRLEIQVAVLSAVDPVIERQRASAI
jgi:[protein-PII] uridylyltransferase